MATLNIGRRSEPRIGTVAVRALVVGLTLATAAIHASLGGLLFMANAIGYSTLAIAMVVPGPIGQVRWLVRLALIGFASATIAGWVLFGTRFPLAYIDKSIELALIGVVALELWRLDGGPAGVLRSARHLVARVVGTRLSRAPR